MDTQKPELLEANEKMDDAFYVLSKERCRKLNNCDECDLQIPNESCCIVTKLNAVHLDLMHILFKKVKTPRVSAG
jgi:hypothetical protein